MHWCVCFVYKKKKKTVELHPVTCQLVSLGRSREISLRRLPRGPPRRLLFFFILYNISWPRPQQCLHSLGRLFFFFYNWEAEMSVTPWRCSWHAPSTPMRPKKYTTIHFTFFISSLKKITTTGVYICVCVFVLLELPGTFKSKGTNNRWKKKATWMPPRGPTSSCIGVEIEGFFYIDSKHFV